MEVKKPATLERRRRLETLQSFIIKDEIVFTEREIEVFQKSFTPLQS